MPGLAPGPVRDLLAARDAGRRDQRRGALGPDGREQPLLADPHRQLVVLLLEAERAGHPAAAGVQLDDLADAGEQLHRGARAGERLLESRSALEGDDLNRYKSATDKLNGAYQAAAAAMYANAQNEAPTGDFDPNASGPDMGGAHVDGQDGDTVEGEVVEGEVTS